MGSLCFFFLSMNECSGGFFHAHTTSCVCCYVTLQELFYWFMKYEIWSYVEMSANWSSLHVNYKPGWERLIAQPRTSQRGNQYKTSFVFELEKVQDVQTNYTKRINSANHPKYLFDPRKDIQAKLFTQTPLMKTDLAYWSVMMLTQHEVFLKGGLSLFLMSCHIKTSEGQQQTAAWMSGTLWELKTD